MSELLRRLARYRVRLGFICAVGAFVLARPTMNSLAWGASIAVIGQAVRIWAAGHLEKGREVTTAGPYRLSRHPLYLGSSIMGLGVAVASARFAAILLVALYLVLTIGAAIRGEESHLTEKFGSAYPEYREGRAPEAKRRFSMARAMRNREYRSVLGMAAALALLFWKAL